MRDQETGSTERLVNRTPGAYCDFALFEADGTCRVIAAHSKRAKLQPGMEFFPGVGASGSEVQFALHALLDLREHYVLIRSDAGPVLLSDYFYLSVRLICAVIPHVRTESAARVSHNCFSEIVLSPALSALKMEPVAGDENTYVLLQHIRSCLRDGFPRATANETCPAQEAIRSVYRSAQMLTELVGSRFHMTYPETDRKYRIQYDPVIGTLCLLVYFCYVDRVVGNSNILLSVLPSDGAVRMELSKEVPGREEPIPELAGLRDLERYSRQTLDFVRVGDRVTLRLLLSPSEDPDLLGLKCFSPAERAAQPVLVFDLSIFE